MLHFDFRFEEVELQDVLLRVFVFFHAICHYFVYFTAFFVINSYKCGASASGSDDARFFVGKNSWGSKCRTVSVDGQLRSDDLSGTLNDILRGLKPVELGRDAPT